MSGYFLTNDPLIRPLTDGRELWRVEEPVGFVDSKDREWWTGRGFLSDGLSMPKHLRPLFGHPFRSNYLRPAIIHDWYYQAMSGVLKGSADAEARKAVDWMFFEALMADGVSTPKAYMMYLGVRLGGWYPWARHIARKQAEVDKPPTL